MNFHTNLPQGQAVNMANQQFPLQHTVTDGGHQGESHISAGNRKVFLLKRGEAAASGVQTFSHSNYAPPGFYGLHQTPSEVPNTTATFYGHPSHPYCTDAGNLRPYFGSSHEVIPPPPQSAPIYPAVYSTSFPVPSGQPLGGVQMPLPYQIPLYLQGNVASPHLRSAAAPEAAQLAAHNRSLLPAPLNQTMLPTFHNPGNSSFFSSPPLVHHRTLPPPFPLPTNFVSPGSGTETVAIPHSTHIPMGNYVPPVHHSIPMNGPGIATGNPGSWAVSAPQPFASSLHLSDPAAGGSVLHSVRHPLDHPGSATSAPPAPQPASTPGASDPLVPVPASLPSAITGTNSSTAIHWEARVEAKRGKRACTYSGTVTLTR